ncbi:bifunctional metallophosphatase/5'-nucleotidase [Radiobacillus deserti]|uniref:Bifunctional metallophosphatase/5'-nucleotidase n=1 Tax=Radiobacillus deserti TaxID=2594883 RepID=A0A516KD78_9BACI|nr:5'-nucleotidase C-terminal domain-containing protein [Radiobacillus deserti]QDP39307.1 bifunctional metallophosphatase/5'-nucleotidase [Radiobacillus deserti]
MRLKIIHTNDVHSNFESFMRAATLIRQHTDEDTLILDGGDFADFKSIELQGTRGMAAIELLQSLEYDALTIGNNEMFNGMETLEYMASSSSIPFISNNLLKKNHSHIKGVHSSIILNKKGLRILITGSSPDLQEFNDGLGIHVQHYKEQLKKELEKQRGTYDLCILLSHIGTELDTELALEISELDLIISAHDHQLYEQAKVVNGTIMNSAGMWAGHIGIVEVDVQADKVELVSSETISTETAEKDEATKIILAENKEKAIEVLSESLYSLATPLWHDVVEENPITNLIADGLKDMLQCDIGLMNSGIVNSGLFDFVSNKKLIEICPSPLNPTTFKVKGKHIKEALQQSLDVQACLADGRGPGFRGRFVGRLHISGAEVIHDGQKLINVMISGVPMENDYWYSVASSDYLQRGSGYESLSHNKDDVYEPEEIKDVIRVYAQRKEFIERAQQNRWSQIRKIRKLLSPSYVCLRKR